MTAQTFPLIQEIILLAVSAGCLALSISIYLNLKGGSLSTPWIFFIIAFGLSTIAAVIQVMDLSGTFISQYDLRLTMLILRPGALIFILLGLFFYKKGIA